MNLRKFMYLALAVLLVTSVAFPQRRSSPTTGVWDFKLAFNRSVGSDGFIKKSSSSADWVVRLKQDGEKLTGQLVGAKSDDRRSTPCADADISGSVKGGKMEFVLTYQGWCCGDEQLNFAGEVGEDGKTLSGKFEPADVPRGNCSLGYADVTGAKRESLRDGD